MRCTSCDFHVIWFDDHLWHSKSDYLFFRNNVPDREKLKKYLIRKKGETYNSLVQKTQGWVGSVGVLSGDAMREEETS